MNAVSLWYLIWIALTTAGFWFMPAKYRHIWLTGSTSALLIAVSPWSLLLLTVMSVTSGYVIIKNTRSLIAPVIIAITLCLFGVKALQQIQATTASIPLLFGISFYTLRIIHLLIEFYLDRLKVDSPQQLQSYLFFPAIIAAGPIQRFDTFKQLNHGNLDLHNVSRGLQRILHGTALIIVVHNVLVQKLFMPWLFDTSVQLNWPVPVNEWISCLDYGLSLYLQFSAYSSIAIGFALLLGFHLDENFNWPFLRPSLIKFWRNWHISLSGFCRTYIFTGTMAVSRSIPLAFIASMLAIGIWHSLSLNFVFWGIYHGVGLIITQIWVTGRAFEYLQLRIPASVITLAGWAFTFNYVILSFAFTKHNTLAESLQSWGRLSGFSHGG